MAGVSYFLPGRVLEGTKRAKRGVSEKQPVIGAVSLHVYAAQCKGQNVAWKLGSGWTYHDGIVEDGPESH